ncbi:hypothetical protein JCM10213_000734 [Rhodosporidiobolus nylandii]
MAHWTQAEQRALLAIASRYSRPVPWHLVRAEMMAQGFPNRTDGAALYARIAAADRMAPRPIAPAAAAPRPLLPAVAAPALLPNLPPIRPAFAWSDERDTKLLRSVAVFERVGRGVPDWNRVVSRFDGEQPSVQAAKTRYRLLCSQGWQAGWDEEESKVWIKRAVEEQEKAAEASTSNATPAAPPAADVKPRVPPPKRPFASSSAANLPTPPATTSQAKRPRLTSRSPSPLPDPSAVFPWMSQRSTSKQAAPAAPSQPAASVAAAPSVNSAAATYLDKGKGRAQEDRPTIQVPPSSAADEWYSAFRASASTTASASASTTTDVAQPTASSSATAVQRAPPPFSSTQSWPIPRAGSAIGRIGIPDPFTPTFTTGAQSSVSTTSGEKSTAFAPAGRAAANPPAQAKPPQAHPLLSAYDKLHRASQAGQQNRFILETPEQKAVRERREASERIHREVLAKYPPPPGPEAVPKETPAARPRLAGAAAPTPSEASSSPSAVQAMRDARVRRLEKERAEQAKLDRVVQFAREEEARRRAAAPAVPFPTPSSSASTPTASTSQTARGFLASQLARKPAQRSIGVQTDDLSAAKKQSLALRRAKLERLKEALEVAEELLQELGDEE